MVQAAKTKKISDLETMLKGAKSIILSDFTGLNVKDISELRRVCREKGIKFRVVKNTLAKRSFQDLGFPGIAPMLEGPTAIAISTEDEVLPAQVIKKFADDYELPRLKGGYVSGRVLSDKEVIRLAALPGRDVLLAQVVGTTQAPLRGLVNCLSASLRDLVNVVKAIEDKKGAAAA
jgi:large subunit ribosomal protein L10